MRLESDEHDPWFDKVFFCFAVNDYCISWILFRLPRFALIRLVLKSLLPPLTP